MPSNAPLPTQRLYHSAILRLNGNHTLFNAWVMLPAHHAPNYAATPHAPRRTACSTLHRPPYPKPPPPFRGEFSSAYSKKISIYPVTLSEDRSDAACRVVLSSPLLLLLGVPNLPNPPSKQGKPPYTQSSLSVYGRLYNPALYAHTHCLTGSHPPLLGWKHLLSSPRELLLALLHMLHVAGMQNLLAPTNRRLHKSLPTTDLAHRPCSVKFPLKTLEGSLYVLPLLHWNDNHRLCLAMF